MNLTTISLPAQTLRSLNRLAETHGVSRQVIAHIALSHVVPDYPLDRAHADAWQSGRRDGRGFEDIEASGSDSCRLPLRISDEQRQALVLGGWSNSKGTRPNLKGALRLGLVAYFGV